MENKPSAGKNKGKHYMILPYSHADYAWCHSRRWHEIRYRSVFEDLLSLLERHPDFKWYLDCFSTNLLPVLEEAPHLAERLNAFVESGNIAICGTFSNLRPGSAGGEMFIRNMILGRRMFLSCFPRAEIIVSADAVDTALGHPQIPQLLRKAGFRYLRAGRPYGVLKKKGIPHGFVWEGLDGTRIPAWWDTYDGFCYQEQAEILNGEDDPKKIALVYETVLKKYDDSDTEVIAVAQGSDDGLPLGVFGKKLTLNLFDLIRLWNEKEPSRMSFATPNEFFRELEKEPLPVVKGTIDIADVCYNVAWGGEKGLAAKRLQADRRLVEMEQWEAISHALFGAASPDREELWKDALICCAHATAWLFTEDFDRLIRKLGYLLNTCDVRTADALRAITERIALPENTLAVLYNPASSPCRATVRLKVPNGAPDSLLLQDGQGNPLKLQTVQTYSHCGTWEADVLIQPELPPAGYTVITAARGEIDCRYPSGLPKASAGDPLPSCGGFILQSDVLSLSFSNGDLCSVRCGDQELKSGDRPFNSVFVSKINTSENSLHTGPVLFDDRITFSEYRITENGPLRFGAELYAKSQYGSFTQYIFIEQGGTTIRFELKAELTSLEGYLSCGIPTDQSGRLYGGIPFGTEPKNVLEEPYSDNVWSDIHRNVPGLFLSKDFVSARFGGLPVSLVAVDGDRYYRYLKETGVLSYILIQSVRQNPRTWEKHANRFSFQASGEHMFRYAVCFDCAEDMVTRAELLRTAPVCVKPYRSRDVRPFLPTHGSFLSLSGENAVLSAFYYENGQYTLRLWESRGQEADVSVSLPLTPQSARICDLLGNPEENRSVRISENRICTKIKPYEILTVVLT